MDGLTLIQLLRSVAPVVYAVLYVLVLYIPSINVNLALRDTPAIIRYRIKVILYFCVFCGLSTAWLTKPSNKEYFPHAFFILGIWPCNIWDVVRPVILVFSLFLGPFVKKTILLSDPSITRRSATSSSIDRSVKYYINWRNYVVGPFSEEFIFRSCMISLLHQKSVLKIILITSILFGLAHMHHLYEYYRSFPSNIKAGIFAYLFQFFYTMVFGSFVSYLYISTQNLWSIVLVHSFCNWMGFPQLYGLVGSSKLKTSIYYTTLCLGIAGFIVFFKQFTQPSSSSKVFYG
ncbi:hypothetical protein T552_02990 [Pneumocystis carinii B80]|uniref:intramembrane prenyl-peptidase Rce1 n=1 Tax=Pneumocystis carinii (strain B80) TaxID=1408658 RepID=A0A0W4ZCF9_PNEC8|nr:hypothetical protein T552_02990 [Pneumocystis carinii B80]KTW26095.1 hypothetical protein T552_02990 [Pneumocystis carinii B80]